MLCPNELGPRALGRRYARFNLPSAFFKIRREREREERPPAQVGIWGAAAAEALLQQKPIFGRAGPVVFGLASMATVQGPRPQVEGNWVDH